MTEDDNKAKARRDKEEDKAEACYWAAAARQWAADDKVEAHRRSNEAVARLEAAVTSWTRYGSHTLEELRRAYRATKPKIAKQGDNTGPREEASSPREELPHSPRGEPFRPKKEIPSPREEPPGPRQEHTHPNRPPPP